MKCQKAGNPPQHDTGFEIAPFAGIAHGSFVTRIVEAERVATCLPLGNCFIENSANQAPRPAAREGLAVLARSDWAPAAATAP